MSDSVTFGARFQKLPGQIKAVKMDKSFEVDNPWGEGKLQGQAGDSLVTNLLNGEQYPIGPKALADKYEPVEGDVFQTRMDKPVYIEADLPKGDSIESREGSEKTNVNGIQAMEAIDAEGKPYAIPGDYFLKAYAPIDAAGRKIVEALKALLPKEKVDIVEYLKGVKDAKGKVLLDSDDIKSILKNRNGLGGIPIDKYEEKIMAVLDNPEEVEDISQWKSRAAGIWRAAQDPLNSTVEANPDLF